MTDDRGQMSEVRSQKSEDRRQMTEVRCQKSEAKSLLFVIGIWSVCRWRLPLKTNQRNNFITISCFIAFSPKHTVDTPLQLRFKPSLMVCGSGLYPRLTAYVITESIAVTNRSHNLIESSFFNQTGRLPEVGKPPAASGLADT